jgi:adrenodoxin-NADP+ reductase
LKKKNVSFLCGQQDFRFGLMRWVRVEGVIIIISFWRSTIDKSELLYITNLAAMSTIMMMQRASCFRMTTASRGAAQRCWVSNKARIAIVGSGPSGCYTAKYLLPHHDTIESIHVIDKLPTPFGLVRSGVAPDHAEVKNVQNDFSALFSSSGNDAPDDDKVAVDLFANVAVGKDVSLEELRKLYDIVVLAYGCENNRTLGIPGEDELKGVVPAREFVAWYNGHPDYQTKNPLELPDGKTAKNIVVLGHGNVALDCARILRKGVEGLKDTDIVQNALLALEAGGDMHVSVLGRRGHIQGAFTIKELRELTKLPGFYVAEPELDMGMSTAEDPEPLPRPKQRIDTLLRKAAAIIPEEAKISLRFFWNPVRFRGDRDGRLTAVVCERTKLGDDGHTAVGTGQFMAMNVDLALVSVGYKGVAVPGLEEFFSEDEGRVLHSHGKVDDATDDLGGLYVAGWLKRGPSGIIGTNIADAKDTVESIVKDLGTGSSSKESSASLKELLESRNVQIVDWNSYQCIDAVETSPERKRSDSQPREKLPSYQELLEAASVK